MLELISAKTLGQRLELHASTVRRLARRAVNPMPCVRIGGSIRFDPQVVERWLSGEGENPVTPRRHVFLSGKSKRKGKRLEMRAGL